MHIDLPEAGVGRGHGQDGKTVGAATHPERSASAGNGRPALMRRADRGRREGRHATRQPRGRGLAVPLDTRLPPQVGGSPPSDRSSQAIMDAQGHRGSHGLDRGHRVRGALRLRMVLGDGRARFARLCLSMLSWNSQALFKARETVLSRRMQPGWFRLPNYQTEPSSPWQKSQEGAGFREPDVA